MRARSDVALEVEGLVEVRIGSGVTVREAAPATSTVRVDSAAGPFELLRARRAVEGECAALAAARIRPVEIEQIAAALEEMRAQIAAGKAPVPADCQFHVRIANATGNSMLARLVDQLNNERFGPLYQRFDWHIFNQSTWNATLREHEAVLAALRARDPEAARRAMHRHLDGAYKRFSKGWGERRGSSTTPAEPRRASVRRGGTQARTTRP